RRGERADQSGVQDKPRAGQSRVNNSIANGIEAQAKAGGLRHHAGDRTSPCIEAGRVNLERGALLRKQRTGRSQRTTENRDEADLGACLHRPYWHSKSVIAAFIYLWVVRAQAVR